MGQGMIFINENKPPYIVIKTDNDFYIVNFKDSDKTREQYEELGESINNK